MSAPVPRRGPTLAAAAWALLAGCSPPPADPLPPGSFAFGVFGDGPYYAWERGRFRRVLADVGRTDVVWLLHVGDILWYPCTDDAYGGVRAQLDAVGRPVVYTPGDNEWTDCHEARPGGYAPLDRLAALRRIFFAEPGRTLGARPLAVTSQAGDEDHAEFVENARWTYGGFVFATLHVVGSANGGEPFPGRTPAADAEVERRTTAALAWLDATFASAREASARGVVLALHADLGLGEPEGPYRGFTALVARLREHVASFPGPVLLIHGDSHELRLDHPLLDERGEPHANFARLETFGSPDIGWVRVVVDSVAGEIAGVEPRLMKGWW